MCIRIAEEPLSALQKEALRKYDSIVANSFFVGVSREWVIQAFNDLNVRKKTELEKALETERAIFTLCGFDPGDRLS